MSKKPVPAPLVPLDIIDVTYADRDANPNKLDDERFEGLAQLMKELGCLQPILLWQRDLKSKRYRLIDGHHRYWIAKKLGWEEIDAIIFTGTEEQAQALSLAMNRLRGDLDMTLSAEIMKEIMINSGWDTAQLALYTGFADKEVEALVNQAKNFDDANLGDLAGGEGEDTAPPVEKPFVLEVSFATKEELKLVRRKLKKAAGKGGDLAKGLLNVLGEDDHGTE